MTLRGKTLFITGASRGIGLAIGLRAARDGANVAIAAKTAEPHPKLPGTIYSAAAEIEAAGGKALPLVVDVRDEAAVKEAIEKTAAAFGGLDIVVNNASAISLTPTPQTDMKRFDLMHQVNTRGTYMVSKYAIPYLEKAENPHILMLSPPLDMKEKWFAPNVAYSIAKYGMSLCVLGLAGELRARGIARQRLVAAHDDRDERDQEPARRRRDRAGKPHARHPGRRRLRDLPEIREGVHRQFPDRRHFPGRGRRDGFRAVPGRSVRAAGAGLLRAGRHPAALDRIGIAGGDRGVCPTALVSLREAG